MEKLQRERAGTRGASNPRAQDGARNRDLSRLLHGTRGQPVRQFVGDRRLRGLPHEGDRALCRPRVSHADHSGDAYFEFVYWHEWPNTLNELAKYRPRALKAGRYDVTKAEKGADRGRDDGRVKRFLEAVWQKPKLSTAEGNCIMNLCMAATYDPDPRAPNGFRLPVNLETGEVISERWNCWRANDPVNLVTKYRKNLESLRGI